MKLLKKIRWSRVLRVVVLTLGIFYGWVIFSLFLLKWIDPPTTAVQIQRRVESWTSKGSYTKRQKFIPLEKISVQIQRAVIAAEDGRFYQHNGFDWKQIRTVAVQAMDEDDNRRIRGASTITQQLVKNLFLTLHGSVFRKAIEATIVPLAELILGKQRILELYLNVIEWGPGIYGAEAASQYHYKMSATRINREQASRLAAIVPSPLRRKITNVNRYSGIILKRMSQHGW